MTVLCLVEHDQGGIIDASLAALAFARTLAASSAAASAEPAAASGRSAVSGEGPVAAPGELKAERPRLAAVVIRAAETLPVSVLSALGVADAYAVESDQLGRYAPLAWARVLAELITVSSAEAVVAAGTDRGQEVLAHLGAITGVPMVANCVSVSPSGAASYRIVRQRWAGSLLEECLLEASPALLTVAAGAVAAGSLEAPATDAVQTRVHMHTPALSGEDLRVRATESAERSAGVSLATARVVIGGGRGVGAPEGFAALEELASLLGGAVGVSRVVTSLGWRPHEQQVGQTGTRIAPELYLACGISGAIQHMAGCLGAKHIIAINTDPAAPIIGRADYAVIGDLNEVIPALVTAIKTRGS